MKTEEEKVLSDIVMLLCEVQWMYDFPVTQVFTRNVLNQMPEEWRAVFKDISLDALNGIPEFNTMVHWPTSLKEFLKQCEKLSLHHWVLRNGNKYSQVETQDIQLPNVFGKGMSVKKRHEALSLVHLVKKLSDKTNCQCVLDIGSGIGYIDSLLHLFMGKTVLGAESDAARVKSACDRQAGLAGTCNGVKHIHWVLQDDEVTYDRAKNIAFELANHDVPCTCDKGHRRDCLSAGEKELSRQGNDNLIIKEKRSQNDASAKNSVMLLGLHSCADLSPIMINIFKNCVEISSLVLLSCCYHKMELTNTCEKAEGSASVHENFIEESQDAFANFPMSKALKRIMKDFNFKMSVYGLRLAAQESGVRWSNFTKEDHQSHEKNVVYRALLEVFCLKEGISLRKRRRRCARKSKFCEFGEYVKTVTENYEFVPEMLSKPECKLDYREESALVTTGKASSNLPVRREFQSDPSSACESLRLGSKEDVPVSQDYITEGLYSSYKIYEHTFSLIEPLTGLQLALQPVLETLVLVDRVMYLKECNFDEVWLERVFDESISPRNTALIAMKK